MRLLIVEVDKDGSPVCESREILERPLTHIMGIIWDWFEYDPTMRLIKVVCDHGDNIEVHRG